MTNADILRVSQWMRESDTADDVEIQQQMDQDGLREAEALAAVSGFFDPVEIAKLGSERSDSAHLLSRLSAECVCETLNGKRRWLLKPDARRKMLNRLNDEGELPALLEGTLPQTDSVGRILRMLLRHKGQPASTVMSSQELVDLAAANELAKNLSFLQSDVRAAEDFLAHSRFISELHPLLRDGFFGRSEELRIFESFLQETPKSSRFSLAKDSLMLTGMGGAGKSTLLAMMIRGALTDKIATIVLLDFDRPGVRADDTFWLDMEMIRQIAAQYPEIANPLRELRQSVRDHEDRRESSSRRDSRMASRAFSTAFREVVGLLQNSPGREKPVVLILDTFEEVRQEVIGHLLEWIEERAGFLRPMTLKLVVSGRFPEPGNGVQPEILQRLGIERKISVSELEVEPATDLLRSFNVEDSLAKQITDSKVLPLRPLELRLIARLINSGDLGSIKELEKQLEEGGAAIAEIFTALIYRRVLLRMSPETRDFASPGLVLRYLTAELIREVLVPALCLPSMNSQQADVAMNALRQYEWLVYQSGDQLWHTKELRRTMLKAMMAQEPEKARQIHERAIEYFEKRHSDSGKDSDLVSAELVYHKLMLVEDLQSLSGSFLDEIRKAYRYFVDSLSDFSLENSIFIRFTVNEPISAEEVLLLPPRYIMQASEKPGSLLVSLRQWRMALSFSNSVRRLSAPEEEVCAWINDTLFATARWNDLRDVVQRNRFLPTTDSVTDAGLALFSVLDPMQPPDLVLLDEVYSVMFQGGPKSGGHLERDTFLEKAILTFLLDQRNKRGSATQPRFSASSMLSRSGNYSPLLIRRSILLCKLLDQKMPSGSFTIDLSSLRLNRRWLNWFIQQEARSLEQNGLSDAAYTLLGILQRGASEHWSCEELLTFVEEQGRSIKSEARFRSDYLRDERIILLDLAHGPPELRDPVHFALMEAFTTTEEYELLAEVLSRHIELPLRDLEPLECAGLLAANGDKQMEVYVELADRCGVLGDVLQSASEIASRHSALSEVSAAYKKCQRALTELCNNAGVFNYEER